MGEAQGGDPVGAQCRAGVGRGSGHLTSEPPPYSRPSPPGLGTTVSAGPAVIECWLVEDAGRGRLAKKPAALLLRQGSGRVPPRPDLDPELYLKVHGESSRTHPQVSHLHLNVLLFRSRIDLGLRFPSL